MTAANKPNLLYLVHRAPFPPDRGDRIRTYHILRHLAARYHVYLGALLDEPVTNETRAVLEAITVDRALVPLGRHSRWLNAARSLAAGRSATEGLFASPALTARVQHWAGTVRFDATFAFCSSMVQYTELPELANVPLFLDLIDVDSQKWLDYAQAARGWKRWLFNLEASRVRRLECSLPARAKAITLVSDAEADIYRSFCPNDKTRAVMNGVDLDYFTNQFPVSQPRPNQCVFVGVLDYRANVESLIWFCREVWRQVLARKPDAEFAIVGKNPAPAVRALGRQPGVRLLGPVPDVRPYIAESRFVVAPLLVGRGIQNKVLEAMAMGKAVVASPQALEGLRLQRGVQAIGANLPEEWIAAIGRLNTDQAFCREVGAAAREYVQNRHAWATCLSPMAELLHYQEPHALTESFQLPRAIAVAT